VEIDFNLINTEAKLALAGNVGNVSGSGSGSTSLLAPLPAFGPVFRWYPLHDSNRLSIAGSFRGMPFFGYGNFLSARGDVGIGLTQHLNLRAGWQVV
jgi:hypothetical protein